MKYEEIVEHIKREIKNEKIKPGTKLPSIRELSSSFSCSKATAVRAYDELDKEHIIYSIKGSGYYLVEKGFMLEHSIENEIIDFASAAPDFEILPYKDFKHCIDQAIDLYKESLFSYTDVQGLEPLIKVMAKQLQEDQIFVALDSIFITTGSQQTLDILSRMPFPNKRCNVVVEQPTYQGMLGCLEINDISTIGVTREIDGLNMKDLERIFKNGNVKFFYTIPRFNNPLGLSYTKEEKKHIIKLAEKYDVYIVEDDYLGDMDADTKADPIYSFDESSRVIYIKSFSKVLLPGLRIGVAVLPRLLINEFRKYKKCADLNTPVLSQGALEIYIKSGMFNAHVKKVSELYSNRLSFLKGTIEKFNSPNIRVNIPQGGFFAGIEIMNEMKASSILSCKDLSHIKFTEMNKCYLKEFYNDKTLRISIARADEEKIGKAVPLILNEIDRNRRSEYGIFHL